MSDYSVCNICANGTKEWYLNGQLHREDGPAVETPDGSKFWYLNGKWHREDGPAIEFPDGSKSWRLNGKEYTEQEHKFRVQMMKRTGQDYSVLVK